MYQVQLTYTASGKKYTFLFDELAKGVLSDTEIAKIKQKVLKEIQKTL